MRVLGSDDFGGSTQGMSPVWTGFEDCTVYIDSLARVSRGCYELEYVGEKGYTHLHLHRPSHLPSQNQAQNHP
jgi:hypothetical protein